MTLTWEQQQRRPRMVGFSLTDRCNIQCAHCLIDATAQGADYTEDEVRRIVRELKASGIQGIGITGGEPFMKWDLIRACVEEARECGLFTTVITNGFWARTYEEARRRLEPLQGLRNVAISTDEWHQPFVPLEKVHHAVNAAVDLGIKATVRITYMGDAEVFRARYAAEFPKAKIELQELVHTGRAEELTERHVIPYKARCSAVHTPVIRADGHVSGCCGPGELLKHRQPLWLGDSREEPVDSILARASEDLLYQIIRTRGPYGLWELLEGEEGFRLEDYDLSSNCTLCTSLLSDPRALEALAVKANSPERYHELAVEQLLYRNDPAMLLAERRRQKEAAERERLAGD